MFVTAARIEDIPDLRALYSAVYGNSYPLPLADSPETMARLIADPVNQWGLVHDPDNGTMVGSALVRVDATKRIGRLEGLVVHPDQRGAGLAKHLTAYTCDQALDSGTVDSIFATVRTVSVGPQRVVSENGFRPMGILPNIVNLTKQETLALYCRYANGVLEKRAPVASLPIELLPLLRAAEKSFSISYDATLIDDTPRAVSHRKPTHFEVIEAPEFVQRRFSEKIGDLVDWFYPIHLPNLMATPTDGSFEVYGFLSRSVGFCALVDADPNLSAATASLDGLFDALVNAGATYVTVLVSLADRELLSAFLAEGFLPNAIYPAKRREGDFLHDQIALSRTTHPIDLRGIVTTDELAPYVEAYTSMWSSTFLPHPVNPCS